MMLRLEHQGQTIQPNSRRARRLLPKILMALLNHLQGSGSIPMINLSFVIRLNVSIQTQKSPAPQLLQSEQSP
jgi:hypothetical protein